MMVLWCHCLLCQARPIAHSHSGRLPSFFPPPTLYLCPHHISLFKGKDCARVTSVTSVWCAGGLGRRTDGRGMRFFLLLMVVFGRKLFGLINPVCARTGALPQRSASGFVPVWSPRRACKSGTQSALSKQSLSKAAEVPVCVCVLGVRHRGYPYFHRHSAPRALRTVVRCPWLD